MQHAPRDRLLSLLRHFLSRKNSQLIFITISDDSRAFFHSSRLPHAIRGSAVIGSRRRNNSRQTCSRERTLALDAKLTSWRISLRSASCKCVAPPTPRRIFPARSTKFVKPPRAAHKSSHYMNFSVANISAARKILTSSTSLSQFLVRPPKHSRK